jgi:hypothetical protein
MSRRNEEAWTNDELLRRVAAVAHDCWVAKMRSDGWLYGPAYDADRKAHSAMAPFDELSDDDQRSALLCARVEELCSTLAGAMDYPRGPDRPFFLHEMREGRRVALKHDRRLAGAIVGWETKDGALDTIRVRWDDGAIDEFDPWEQALSRPEEEPAQPSR